MAESPSIRSLAAGLNLSRATVSEALRGSPRVKKETRRRVVAEAERLGYRLDPVASELMAQMRRSVSNAFRGAIALVVPEEAGDSDSARRRRAVLRGAAEARAAELGFKLDPVAVNAGGWARLASVLRARGVVGALVLPSAECRPEHRALLAAANIQAVYADAPEEGAEHVDAIAPDYRQALALARTRLSALGRRRPGLLLVGGEDSPDAARWRAAWEMHAAASRREAPPPFVPESRLILGLALERWRREHEVDAMLVPGVPPEGAEGLFCSLDLSAADGASCGVELRWDEIGERAVELLARGYFDRLRGRRCAPALVLLPARWRAEACGDRADAELAVSAGSVEEAPLATIAV